MNDTTKDTMNALLKNALDAIEQACQAGVIDRNAARAAEIALHMKGDEAMLANRVMAQGADPASLDYMLDGVIAPEIRHAHTRGPGLLEGEDRLNWLVLATQSADESKAHRSTLRERMLRFANAWRWLMTEPEAYKRTKAKELETAIKLESRVMCSIGGVLIPVYTRDIGFAAAYWSGSEIAAVYSSGGGATPDSPYLAIGTKLDALPESVQAVCDKQLSLAFQLVLHDEELIASVGAAIAEAALLPN